MWCATLSIPPPCTIDPAGTNIVAASFSPGTGDPHTLQNDICQSAFGFFHVAMCSAPETQRNRSFGTRTTAIPLLPVALRQIEQWQTKTPDGATSIAYLIAPQLHSPLAIVLSVVFDK